MIAQSSPIHTSTYPTFIGLMIFALPVIVLLVVLLFRSRTARRAFLCAFLYVGGGVLAVMFVSLLVWLSGSFFISFGTPVRATKPTVSIEPVVPLPLTSGSQPSVSISKGSGRDLPFEPDVYASKASAILGAARSVARQYAQRITSADQRPQTVRIRGYLGTNGEMNEMEMVRVAGETAQVLGASLVQLTTDVSVRQADPQAVELTIDLVREASADFDSGQHGLLRATLAGPLGSFSRQAAFVDKPWGEDFERWRNQGGYADWVEGQSDLLCASADEARTQAMADATRRVIDTVVTHGEKRRLGTVMVSARRNRLESWLGEVVPRWLAMGQLQTDSFVQTYERPYGTLYRCATRVHVPPAKADMLLDAFSMHDRALRTTWLRAILSAVGLLVLISVVYLFLNAATRGYYVWSVRIAAVVMAGFGAWCVLMLM